MPIMIKSTVLLYCRRRWPRTFSTASPTNVGTWPVIGQQSDSTLSPVGRLIQSLRSSHRNSDPALGVSRQPRSLLGDFYSDACIEHPEDRIVLEQLRKLEMQYKKWGQMDKSNQIIKEIAQIEAAGRQRRALRTSNKGSQDSSFSHPFGGSSSGSDIRLESTGVNELIRQGYSEEEAKTKAVENAKARSSWIFGSLDPKKRSRWENMRQKVITGEIDFDNEQDEMSSKLKVYSQDGRAVAESDTDAESPRVSAGGQVQPQERHRIVDEWGRAYGTGRRKTAIARVWLTPSEDNEGIRMTVNGRNYLEYFNRLEHRFTLFEPLLVTGKYGQFNVRVTTRGGGLSGHAGAIRLGVARALQNFDPKLRSILKPCKLLTRDSRMVERKKPGKRKARASFPFVKR